MPKYNLKNMGATTNTNAIVYSYNTPIYAHYTTAPNASVSIDVHLNADNAWWIGGWQSNSYREYIIIGLSGSQDGWTAVKGELVTGEGTYVED
jgi:hypothetical protein